ncbi:MAG TPA: hypothetical protein VI198_07430, partial [Candidatus Eisenbacteria bacterium]
MVTPRARAAAGAAVTPHAVSQSWREGAEPPPFTLAAGPSDYWREHVVEAFRASGTASGAEFLRMEGDDLEA